MTPGRHIASPAPPLPPYLCLVSRGGAGARSPMPGRHDSRGPAGLTDGHGRWRCHDLRTFYVEGHVSVWSGPARLRLDLLPAEARPTARGFESRRASPAPLPHRAGASRGRGGGTCEHHFRLRLLRSRIAARRGGPGRLTRSTLSSRLSRPHSGWQLALGDTLVARLNLSMATASLTA